MFLDIQYKWQYTCPSQLNQTNSIFYFKITPQGITVSIWTELYLQDHEDSDKSWCCYNVIMGPDRQVWLQWFCNLPVCNISRKHCLQANLQLCSKSIYIYICLYIMHLRTHGTYLHKLGNIFRCESVDLNQVLKL